MNWLLATTIATLCFAVYPILGDKAGRIHGEKMNFVIDAAIMLVFALFLSMFNREDFSKINKISLLYAVPGMVLGCVAFYLMLYAWRIAPDKVPIIMVIISFAMVLTAVIYNFLGTKLSFLEWLCVFGAIFCITMLSILQKRV